MPFLPWVPTTANAPTPLPVSLGGTGGATTAAALASLGLAGPLNAALPGDFTWFAWTTDPGNAASSTGALTSGTLYVAEVFLRSAVTVTGVILRVSTAGATLTANQNFVALYDSGGTQRAITADQSGNWTGLGAVAANWTSTFAASAGKFYVAVLSNGTTPPAFGASTTTPALANAGLTAANLRYAQAATAQTSMPASVTPSSFTAPNGLAFCAVIF